MCVRVSVCVSSCISSALSQQVLLSSGDRSGWVETINIQLFRNSLWLKCFGCLCTIMFVRRFCVSVFWH